MRLASVLVLMLFATAGNCVAAGFWAKGNTHVHTKRSADGDSDPAVVIDWYRSHGFNFLAISDHGTFTDPADYVKETRDNFILIGNEEMGATFDGKPVDFGALGIGSTLGAVSGSDMVDTIQKNVDLIWRYGGIPQIHHPNFRYSFGHRELLQVNDCGLLEVYNANVNNAGDQAHVSCEQIWDILLSAGKNVWAIATDDSHVFAKPSPDHGRGYIMVRVETLTPSEVLKNIRAGNFYASTGVTLRDYSFDGRAIAISIQPETGKTYVIEFVGTHGQILQELNRHEAVFPVTGGPGQSYVRAKVICSDGNVAWTQPVRPSRKGALRK